MLVTYTPGAATLIAISGAVQPCKSIQVTSTLPSIFRQRNNWKNVYESNTNL